MFLVSDFLINPSASRAIRPSAGKERSSGLTRGRRSRILHVETGACFAVALGKSPLQVWLSPLPLLTVSGYGIYTCGLFADAGARPNSIRRREGDWPLFAKSLHR